MRLAWAALVLLSAARTAAAIDQQFDQDVARRYAGVARWLGIWEITETRTFSASNAMGYRTNVYEGIGHGEFELTRETEEQTRDVPGGSGTLRWEPSRGVFGWRGSGTARGMRNETWSKWERYGPRMVGEDWRQYDGGEEAVRNVEFQINLGGRSASLHAGQGPTGRITQKREGHAVDAASGGDGQFHYTERTIDETVPGGILTFFIPNYEKTKLKQWSVVQGGPGVLVFSHEDRGHDATGGESVRRSQVVLTPVYDDVECEVTIDGYADWLPRGSIADPKKPGNALVARAVLKSKDGKTKELPEVERFRFELINTSREPGICLNWPLDANDTDFDLRLTDFKSDAQVDQMGAMKKFFSDWGMASAGDYDLESMPGGGVPRWSFPEVSEDAQKGELPDPPKDKGGQPFAEAAIESFDFGAKSELRVTCVLKDGREIIGLMKGEGGGQELVRLPKRAGPDWVAEKWRKEHDVMNLAANDDDEKVAGQKDNGDGFTLYEEYRGWVEKGRHITGDPKRKDFFILNLIDADARGGVALFERLSKLRVHSRLRDGKEMSQEERLMNGNHRDAPHRVQQHGVVISHAAGGAGGYNVGVEGVDKSKAGRPASVKFVYVETHHENGAFAAKSSAENYLNERDAQFAYDRAVAHELLHSVGVDHHGEYVWKFLVCNFQGASAPLNPIHHARFTTGFGLGVFQIDEAKDWRGDRGDTITLLWEDTKRDVVEDSLPAYEAELAKRRADAATESYRTGFAQDVAKMAAMGVNHDAAFWAEYYADNLASKDQTRGIRVGQLGGTDCGNELCVMRYYFANAYEIAGQKNAYYLIRPVPGANRAGRELCTSPAGTGSNAASHDPQSRFGDAHAGRGNCFGDICPNDAIPPRSVVLN